MRDDTPYHTRPASEVARERACMEQVLAAASPVPLVFEAFGGMAVTARVLRARFPRAKIWACDLDRQCVAEYNRVMDRNASCWEQDALEAVRGLRPGRCWGASLDYNQFTIMDLTTRDGWRRELLSEVLGRRPDWFQLTDSAVRYLHLNFTRYGLRDRHLPTYVAALAAKFQGLGYALGGYASHSAATYLLWRRA